MKPEINKGWYTRGYLPHCDTIAPQMITFRLADSLPAEVVQRVLDSTGNDEDSKRKHFERLLDMGHGSCVLRKKACAQVVIDTLKFYDSRYYRLIDWVVMPNHVHAGYDRPQVAMKVIVKAWKGYSSKEIKKILGTSGDGEPLWQAGYHDRFARDEGHLSRMKAYILFNPVTAGIVDDPFDWPFSSIHDHADRREEILGWWRDKKDR